MINFGNIERRPYLGSREIGEVWLGSVKVYPDNSEPPVPDPYEEKYLTFEALEDGTFKLSNNSVSYSLDGGTNWSQLEADTETPTIARGNRIMWKGQLRPNAEYGIGIFSSTGRCNIEGNPMSLLFGDNFGNQTDLSAYEYAFAFLFSKLKAVDSANLALSATTLGHHCYTSMFSDCTSLTTAPELPATTLAHHCYTNMFAGCTSLTTAPVLPATTLVNNCYGYMFYACTSLTTAPELPATTLAEYCYNNMFRGCTGLTTTPSLPATTLAQRCYLMMFYDCTNLTTATELNATSLEQSCYESMFYNCRSLTTAPELPATTLAQRCYHSMFMNCTSLTTAPELPATTLALYCYQSMFYDCKSLNYIKAMFTSTPTSSYTGNWVYGVSSTGTFVKNSAATWNITGVNGIPEDWTTVNA